MFLKHSVENLSRYNHMLMVGYYNAENVVEKERTKQNEKKQNENS